MDAVDEFWSYSTAIYPDISQECLFLQDTHNLDVNIVLFCCWVGRLGKILGVRKLTKIQEIVAPMRHNVTSPLRGVRGYLKGNNSIPDAKTLMQNILKIELEAERSEQTLIVYTAETLGILESSDEFNYSNCTLINLQSYFELTNTQIDGATLNALLGLMIGVFPSTPKEIVEISVKGIFNHTENNVSR